MRNYGRFVTTNAFLNVDCISRIYIYSLKHNGLLKTYTNMIDYQFILVACELGYFVYLSHKTS